MTGPTNKSKQRKLEILKAAQELFNVRGFQDTSVDDIMKKAGAAKGVFYYYFKTKDQLLDALIEQNVAEAVRVASVIIENQSLNALQKLQYILIEEFKAGRTGSDPANHLHNIKKVDMHQRIIAGMVEKLSPVIAKVVEQGISEGLFKTEYTLEVTEIVLAGILFVTDLGIFKWSGEQYLRKIKASEVLIEKALGLESGSLVILSDLL